MSFWGSLFGIPPGPTDAEKSFANRQDVMATTMNNAFQQRLGVQNQIYQNLNRQLTPIGNLGPSQQGFSPTELAAKNTAAMVNAAAAARNAQMSTGAVLAGRGGGGTSGITSGIEAQIRGTEASSAANELAAAQNQIVQENYDVGRQNFWKATSGEQTLGQAQDALQFGQQAGTDLSAASAASAKIDAEKQARTAGFAGLAGGLIKTGLGFVTGGLSNLGTGSSFGENVGNFFKGGVGALAGPGTGTPAPASSSASGLDQSQIDWSA